MKRWLALLLSAVIAVSCLGAAPFLASAYDENVQTLSSVAASDWMSVIRGDTYLTEITMPGTHDSCARKFHNEDIFGVTSALAKCQSLNITEQLNAGVRFLDVRCEVDKSSYSVKTVHGSVDCWNGDDYYYLDYVFQDVYNWLDAHPSETVLICIKEDDGNNGVPAFTNAIYEYIHGYGQGKYFYGENYDYHQRWYLGKSVPRLDDVRGKCVLFNRFDQYIGNEASQGVVVDENESGQKIKYNDYSDTDYKEPVYVNLTSYNTGIGTAHIQDYYKWNTESKIKATQYMLSLGHWRGEYYINYSSTVSDSSTPNPQNLSKKVNPSYATFTYEKTKPSGIFAMDFATEELARYIILNNEGVCTLVEGTDGNINYSLNRKTGVLTISGNGAMNNYAFSSNSGANGMGSTAPWGDQNTNALYERQYNSDLITSIVVEEGVTSIGDYAFYGYDHVTSVSIPNSVTTIGEGAFTKCAALTTLDISNKNITSIGNYAFKDCTGLTKFYTSSGVTAFGTNVFQNDASLTMYGESGIVSETYANQNSIRYISSAMYSVNVKAGNTVLEAENPFAGKDLSKGVTISFRQYCNEDNGWNSALLNFSTGRNDDNRYFIIMANGTILFNDGNDGAGGWNGCYFDINSDSTVNAVSNAWVDIDVTISQEGGSHILKYYINHQLAKTYHLSSICASGYPNGISGNNGIFSYLADEDIRLYYGATFCRYPSMGGTTESYLDNVSFYTWAKDDMALSASQLYRNTFDSELGADPFTGRADNGYYVYCQTSDNNGRTGTAYFPYSNTGENGINYADTHQNPFAGTLTGQGYTISFWQRINGNNYYDRESLTFAQGNTAACKYFTIGTDGYIRYNYGDGGSDSALSDAGLYFDYMVNQSAIVKQQWQFVTLEIVDDYHFKLFVNGVLVDDITVTGTDAYQNTGGLMSFLNSSDTTLYLGSYTPYWGTATLSLDNVTCFNRTLSNAEVYALYRQESKQQSAVFTNAFEAMPAVHSGACAWMASYQGEEGVLYIPSGALDESVTLLANGAALSNSAEIEEGTVITAAYNGNKTVNGWQTVVNGTVGYASNGSFTLTGDTELYVQLANTAAADYSAFDAVMNYADSLQVADYEANSFAVLQQVLSEGAALRNAAPSQIDIDNAVFAVLCAVHDLVPYLNLTVTAPHGSVAVTQGNTTGEAGTYSLLFGTAVTLRAMPDEGYVFAGWLETTTKRIFSKDTTYPFTLTANSDYQALFVKEGSATLYFMNDSGWLKEAVTKTCAEWATVMSLEALLPELPYAYGAVTGYWDYDEQTVLNALRNGEDTTVYAVFESQSPSLPPLPVPQKDVPVLTLTYQYDADNQVASFIMAAGIPENCSVLSAGIAFYYQKAGTFSPQEMELTVNNKMLVSQFEPSDQSDYYIVDLNRFSNFYDYAVRGYITYYDAQGHLKTAYSNQINIADYQQL